MTETITTDVALNGFHLTLATVWKPLFFPWVPTQTLFVKVWIHTKPCFIFGCVNTNKKSKYRVNCTFNKWGGLKLWKCIFVRLYYSMYLTCPLPLSEQTKKSVKNVFFAAAILHPLLTKVFKSETRSFHYFSPRIPKI